MSFNSISPKDIGENVFHLIGDRAMLICAGDRDGFNMMTASWGTLGVLWGRETASVFVRKPRYTYEFLERMDCFTLNFFGDEYREALNFCGANSGRDVDKASATGLVPVYYREGIVCFEQAELVLVCRKLYTHDFDPSNFLDAKIETLYPAKDYHRMYVGGITDCLKK